MESAAAPDYDREPAPASTPPRRLTTVAENPDAPQRPRHPVQPRLFPREDGRRVVEFEEYSPSPPRHGRPRHPDGPRPPKRKPIDGQGSFDFVAAPAPPRIAPLSREQSRRTDLPVAELRFRAMAALFDAGFVLALIGLFLVTVRLCLQSLPTGSFFLGCYGTAGLLIAIGYQLLYCLSGKASLGLQGARLRLVSLDGQPPSRAQRMVRMFAGWVSLASAGMGILWALVDQEKLSWHDHISQTFLTYDD